MEKVQNFIDNELYTSLNNNNKINKIFEIIKYGDMKTLYLRYKENNNDGFIITTTPYYNDSKICFNLTIIAVDSCREPKSSMPKYITNISNDTCDLINNYLSQIGFAV